MAYISANGNDTSYGIMAFILDSTDDISSLPTYCAPGSSAIVLPAGVHFMLNNQHEWVQLLYKYDDLVNMVETLTQRVQELESLIEQNQTI